MDTKLLIVDGEYIHKYKLDKVMTHSDFKEHITVDNVNMSLIVPHGTLSIHYTKTSNSEMIEYIVLKDKYEGRFTFSSSDGRENTTIINEEYTYPQILFHIKYNLKTNRVGNSYVYMPDPRMSIGSMVAGQRIPLHALPLPNIYEDNRVCIGSSNDRVLNDPTTFIDSFYTTTFNADLMDYLPRRLNQTQQNQYHDLRNLEVRIRFILAQLSGAPNIIFPQTHWLKMPRQQINTGEEWNVIERI